MADKETLKETNERLTSELAAAKETNERLRAELAAANEQLAGFKAQQAQTSADEVVIREKMSRGLTRDQAINVIKRQRFHDQAEAGPTKK